MLFSGSQAISESEARQIAGLGFAPGAGGGFYKLSADHSECKQAGNIGNNTRSWHVGTCSDAGYIKPAGSFLGRQFYQKATPDDLKNYKIPSAWDPHYSASGSDRYIG
eukprot:CAMPEP_0179439764 /NCGR_PEP_ID=MMETSP0799-20121207/23385_1 /TAXON_ID=46947 /ORGANISM="Geminigera cryophila, Strain CCMP2564" /LENGTH=107 /DNA_ID=CAMNT_0021222483 /DNA_START=88 /DNA_END=411 /DNA_ORIENTATION=-